MKKLSKKFMLSIVAIALVVIALGTSTFAWFTLSNKASVGQFNAEVTAGEGMELSLDQINWYSSIPEEVIQTQIKTNFETEFEAEPVGVVNTNGAPILTAVTTTDLNAFNKLKADQTGWETAIANVDYIKIKIYVRAVNLNTVSIDSLLVTGTADDWKADANFTDGSGQSVISGEFVNVSAANAARVGIKGTSTFVFENEASSSAPINHVLGNTIPTNGQADYFYQKNLVNPNDIEGAPESVIDSDTTVGTGVEVLTLNPLTGTSYNTGNFDLFVWFEGFDADTYDSILKMPLNIKMSFKGTPVVVVTP